MNLEPGLHLDAKVSQIMGRQGKVETATDLDGKTFEYGMELDLGVMDYGLHPYSSTNDVALSQIVPFLHNKGITIELWWYPDGKVSIQGYKDGEPLWEMNKMRQSKWTDAPTIALGLCEFLISLNEVGELK